MTPEKRRERVLKRLERRPGITYAWYGEPRSDGAYALMFAIQGQGTGELTIAQGFDPFECLRVMGEAWARDET